MRSRRSPSAGRAQRSRRGRGTPPHISMCTSSPPPTATQPMFAIPPPGGGGGRYTALVMVLVLLAGLGVGFAAGHFIGRPNGKVPGENLVFFEPASMTFPIAGAAFTQTTYDQQRGK